MADHFADRLIAAIARKNSPCCVGIDPVFSKLPPAIRNMPKCSNGARPQAALEAIREFCTMVIEAVAPIVPAVKINTAYFERYYGPGIEVYLELVQRASESGLVVIGDSKRGDVGHTAELYARSQLAHPEQEYHSGSTAPDAVTVHSFLGADGLKPFLDICRQQGKGLFALVQTSNPSAAEVQGFANGAGVTLSEHLASLIHRWGSEESLVGDSGYSALGAVVAPRNVEITKRLRAMMPKSFFLVPGYGAQGLTAADAAHCFNTDGHGALVCASRSVIYAFDDPKHEQPNQRGWPKAIEHACTHFSAEVAQILSL